VRSRQNCRQEPVEVSTPQGRRVAGYLVERGDELVFEKSADGRRHMLRKPEGWAVQQSALATAVRRGASRVVVKDRSCGVWWAWMADFARHGICLSRGHGEQIALELKWWSFRPSGRGVDGDER
jgi:hypothetical protein